MRDYLCRLLLFAHCLSFVITSLVKLVGQLDAHELFSPSFFRISIHISVVHMRMIYFSSFPFRLVFRNFLYRCLSNRRSPS